MRAALLSNAFFFTRPFNLLRSYRRADLRPDLLAGLTVAVILLPQAVAYALLAGLPLQVGLYSAIVSAIVGGLWGSSNQLHTGPTNTASLLILSALIPIAAIGSPKFIVAAGLMAVMVGIFRLLLGLAHLGVLVNFVSDSVIIGFTAGSGVLIIASQLRTLFRLHFSSSPALIDTLKNTYAHLSEAHWLSLYIGMGVILLIILIQRLRLRLPAQLIALVTAAAVVGLIGLDKQGIQVIGQLPRNLPPLAILPLFDLQLIGQLSTGALAIGAIGLVEAMSIARAVASQTGQRVDSNQEFVGQGLANIASGFFSGYVTSGSFTRTAINYKAGARTPLASVFSGLFVLLAVFLLGGLAAYVPNAALAGVLILIAFGMVDRKEIVRILRGARSDAVTLVLTFGATLFFPLEFAVLIGILVSLAVYILRTSTPRVVAVLPDDNFHHLLYQPLKPACTQLAILDILGDLYFGAVNHVEKAIFNHLDIHTEQRFLLLRLHNVNHCDISGIHALESIMRYCRDRGGDLFLVRVNDPVLLSMKSTGFFNQLGNDHFLPDDQAISYLYHKILDPAVCTYECEVCVFLECQNLPRRILPAAIDLHTSIPNGLVPYLTPKKLWEEIHGPLPPLVIDVREPREAGQGHVPEARIVPLFDLLTQTPSPSVIPHDRLVVFVCRGGRRSTRAAHAFLMQGYQNVRVLEGGMLAWETAGLLEAID